ncbi:MAG TPA: sulfatase-like hydrolase/transferase [Phycisphaerae bacterium]|nr:sulfatase-like hydrolase/transferase [Phycisphaerae bacterium]
MHKLLPTFLITLFCSMAPAGPVESAEATPKPKRPNIVFVLIDDMGWGDLSCFADSPAKTEHIDRLGREGIRFTQFYANAPICSPSRVAFTTGQYPGRWRITSYLDRREANRRRGIADWLDPVAPSLARMLAQQGYHTAHVGKWHMGGQRDVGDAPLISQYGFARSITNFEGLGERILPLFEPRPDGTPFDHHPTRMNGELGGGPIHWLPRHDVSRAFVDRAIAEIETAKKAGRPFYLNLWPDDVHSPCQAPPGLRGDGSPRSQYLGVLEELDRQLGRVFEHIRTDPALRDNTIILLASDNGPESGLGSTGGLRGSKGNLYEGGIRSPLIVWAPGWMNAAAVGSKNDKTVVAGMDIAPSLLTLCKAPPEQGVVFDGLDMSDALLGRSSPERSRPVMWSRPPDRPGPGNRWPDLAIRDGDWKLLVNRDGSRPELFNIPADPAERENLADKHPDRVRRLTELVIAWGKQISRSKATNK